MNTQTSDHISIGDTAHGLYRRPHTVMTNKTNKKTMFIELIMQYTILSEDKNSMHFTQCSENKVL